MEHSANDSTQMLVKKLNENFKHLYSSMSANTNVTIREGNQQALGDLKRQFERELEDLRQSVTTMIDELAPAVGTYLYATYDPNKQWKNTTWEKVSEGNFLIAAGDSYTEGKSYGSNEVTLTIDQIPPHSHQIYTGTSGTDLDAPKNNKVDCEYDYAIMESTIIESAGGGKPHSNIPKSIAVPLWKRTK